MPTQRHGWPASNSHVRARRRNLKIERLMLPRHPFQLLDSFDAEDVRLMPALVIDWRLSVLGHDYVIEFVDVRLYK